jgi:hypothetical protein
VSLSIANFHASQRINRLITAHELHSLNLKADARLRLELEVSSSNSRAKERICKTTEESLKIIRSVGKRLIESKKIDILAETSCTKDIREKGLA